MRRRRNRNAAIGMEKWSRWAIAGIAAAGASLTAYLTVAKVAGTAVGCPTGGCDQVLNSSYAEIYGVPLPLFGVLGYLGMGVMALAPMGAAKLSLDKNLRNKIESLSSWGLFLGGAAMASFSAYLMYLLVAEIQEFCIYCIASALFTAGMFVIASLGRRWEDLGQPLFIGFVAAVLTLTTTAAVYSSINRPTIAVDGNLPPVVTTESTPASESLASHLNEAGIVYYGAYWCPHCHDQKQLFGKTAAKKLNYIECDPRGAKAQPQACQQAGVRSFPTWEVEGQLYPGVQNLARLADLSNYQGDRDFSQPQEES
ncbi:MAG: vitamin K epoxide reductase family protein [Cyanophyceae cyanobacterium]